MTKKLSSARQWQTKYVSTAGETHIMEMDPNATTQGIAGQVVFYVVYAEAM
jgi:phosphoribosylformylglycinamidine (FGAM) synthase-like amidotransferase family enzyme